MTYQAQAALVADPAFAARVDAAAVALAVPKLTDPPPAGILARTILQGSNAPALATFVRMAAANLDPADATAPIADDALTAAVTAVWPVVANLYYPAPVVKPVPATSSDPLTAGTPEAFLPATPGWPPPMPAEATPPPEPPATPAA